MTSNVGRRPNDQTLLEKQNSWCDVLGKVQKHFLFQASIVFGHGQMAKWSKISLDKQISCFTNNIQSFGQGHRLPLASNQQAKKLQPVKSLSYEHKCAKSEMNRKLLLFSRIS